MCFNEAWEEHVHLYGPFDQNLRMVRIKGRVSFFYLEIKSRIFSKEANSTKVKGGFQEKEYAHLEREALVLKGAFVRVKHHTTKFRERKSF